MRLRQRQELTVQGHRTVLVAGHPDSDHGAQQQVPANGVVQARRHDLQPALVVGDRLADAAPVDRDVPGGEGGDTRRGRIVELRG